MASFALAAELAAAAPVAEAAAADDADDLLLCARLPSTPPSTAAIITQMSTGTPNLIHGLIPRLFAADAPGGAM